MMLRRLSFLGKPSLRIRTMASLLSDRILYPSPDVPILTTENYLFELDFLEPILSHPQCTILDVGCGYGQFVQCIDSSLQCSVFGADLPDVIDEAVELHQANNQSSLDFLIPCSVFDGLPFPDETFDLVFCHQSFHHLEEDFRAAFEEISRLVGFGGYAIFVEPLDCDHSTLGTEMFLLAKDERTVLAEARDVLLDVGYNNEDQANFGLVGLLEKELDHSNLIPFERHFGQIESAMGLISWAEDEFGVEVGQSIESALMEIFPDVQTEEDLHLIDLEFPYRILAMQKTTQSATSSPRRGSKERYLRNIPKFFENEFEPGCLGDELLEQELKRQERFVSRRAAKDTEGEDD